VSRILRYSALLIVLAIYDGTFTSPLSASGGGGGTAQVWLGTLGGNGSQAYEVSSTGSVVVGYASNASGQYRAFRWTATGGMQDLGDFGYAYAAAYGVSGDGSIVVGEAWDASFRQRAFRWTAAGGLQDLGTWEARMASRPTFPLTAWSWSESPGTPPVDARVSMDCGGRDEKPEHHLRRLDREWLVLRFRQRHFR